MIVLSKGAFKAIATAAISILIFTSVGADAAHAATAKKIDAKVDAALDRFLGEVKGAKEFLQSAKGVLVFAGVIKAGIGIGGERGEGALRIGGQTVDYYSITSASSSAKKG